MSASRRALGIRRLLAAGTTAAVGASLLVVATPALPGAHAVSTPPAKVTSAADLVSAQSAARAQGSKVLVGDRTTATDQTWANPDGSLTTESASGVVRVRQADGSWADVDLTLARGATAVSSVLPAVPVTYGVAGSSTVAATMLQGVPVSVGWGSVLPEPVLSGTRATYPEVRPGVDLVVEAIRTGFEISFVVKAPPSGPLTLPLSLNLPAGWSASQAADGSLSVTDSTGRAVGQGASPIVFGATRDKSTNLPAQSRAVPDVLGAASAVAGGGTTRTWTLTPDPTFFTSPGVTYPVIVDPTYAWAVSADSYVKTDVVTSQYTATRLYVGENSASAKARILLHANSLPSVINGMYVDSAVVKMFNSYSGTCTASLAPVNLWRAGSWNSATVWATQPAALDVNPLSTSYFAHAGWDGTCNPASYDTMSFTSLAQAWANGTATTPDFKITSIESSTAGWKEFYSAEAGSNIPMFSVTYRAYPSVGITGLAPAIGSGPTGYWMPSAQPTLTAGVGSATGSTVQARFQLYQGTTAVGSPFLGNSVAAGSVSKAVVPAGLLQDGVAYTFKAWGVSGGAVSTQPSAAKGFTVDLTAPGATAVSSTQFAQNAWTNGVASGTFSFAATDTNFDHYTYWLDQQLPTALAAGTSSVTINPMPGGWHHLYARGVDKAGNLGPVADYAFGSGSALVSPADGQVTQASVDLIGATAPGATQASFYWRRAATDAWALVPTGHVTPASGSPAFGGWPYVFPALSGNGAQSPTLRWDLAGTDANLTGPVQVGICFGDATACPASPGTSLPTGGNASTVPANVVLDRNAFNVAATSSLGPVGVNLLTGNTQFSAADVSVPGSGGTSLSVSRVLNTATVARTPGNAALGAGNYRTTAVFGPGWTASLPVDSAGSDWTGLVDTGSVLTLQGPDQSTVGFTPGTGNFAGKWVPTGPDSDSLLTLATSATGDCTSGYRCFTLTDGDNVQVVFQTLTATSAQGTLAAPIGFGVTKVIEPGTPGSTAFTSSGGLVTRIVSPVPAGATCTDPSSASTWTAGCTGLALSYGTGTTAGQLVAATYLTSTGTAPLQVDVGCWGYDSNGRLTDSWDPRDVPTTGALPHVISCGATPLRSTHYDYDGTGRVTKVTPAWNGTSSPLAGTTISYDATTGRLAHVDRTHLDASGTETTSIAYGVPLTADGTHPEYRPDLTNTATWGQTDSPDPTVGGTVTCLPGAAQASATGDLRSCAISYLDGNGRVVNTASYSGTGATGWHLSTTEYDAQGHTLRTLDPANREEALSPTTGAGALLGLPADTAAAAATLSTVSQYAPNPSDGVLDLVDTFGPFHAVTLADGTVSTARAHTHLAYDAMVPIGGPTPPREQYHPVGDSLHLVMTSTTGASRGMDALSINETDQRVTYSDYDSADATGWTYRTPLQTSTDPTGLNIRSQVVLDPATGRVVQSRMPNDVASASPGSTAGTTKTVYYSTGTVAAPDGDCGGAPMWDGMVCKTYAADLTPTAGAPGLVVTKITGYDYLGRATGTSQTPSGDATHARTSSTVYGFNSTVTNGVSSNPYANAVTQTATSGGLGTALPAQTTSYDTTTGLPSSLSDGSTADASSYDDFGRLTVYNENTSAAGAQTNIASVAYDPTTGRVSSRRDQHQRISYSYNGGSEFRGLPTSVAVDVTATNNSTPALWSGTFTATYDSDGRPVTQTDPNAVLSTLTRDEAGQLVERADTQGSNGWLDDKVTKTIFGQDLTHNGPAGSQTYAYDAAGRLVTAQDAPTTGNCTTRRYLFDANSNRLGITSSTAGSQTCGAGTTPSATIGYDTADRLLTTGTVYDSFGRTTTAPAATVTGGANATLGYFANDLVASQIQGSTTQSWTLDPGQQRLRTHSISGGATETNHYDDAGSDSPDWIAETADASGWTANVGDLLGSLAVTVDQTGAATFAYANLHGDIQATAPAGASAPTISPDVDEFGNTPTGATVPRYGWLGGKQRSGEDLGGLLLMGVRLYNPLTGRFLQADPVPGGSANDYDYANQDPVNQMDLDGRSPTEVGGGGGGSTPRTPRLPGFHRLTTSNSRMNRYARQLGYRDAEHLKREVTGQTRSGSRFDIYKEDGTNRIFVAKRHAGMNDDREYVYKDFKIATTKDLRGSAVRGLEMDDGHAVDEFGNELPSAAESESVIEEVAREIGRFFEE